MEQIKFYQYTSLGLLLINIVILVFFLTARKGPRSSPPPRDNNMKAKMIRMLKLDQEQRLSFITLVEEHEKQISTLNEQQQKLLSPYFESISDTSVHFDETFTLTQFQALNQKKLRLTRQHFFEIKNLLSTEQMPHFESLIEVVSDRITMGGKKNIPPPKD